MLYKIRQDFFISTEVGKTLSIYDNLDNSDLYTIKKLSGYKIKTFYINDILLRLDLKTYKLLNLSENYCKILSSDGECFWIKQEYLELI